MTFLTFWKNHPFFQKSKPELLVKAPGRINLIGEHTDYHMGWVLPAATEHSMWFAFKIKYQQDASIEIHSLWKKETKILSLHDNTNVTGWWTCLENILVLCRQKGMPVLPMQILVDGDLPVGAGLSSSSALTCGFLAGLDKLMGWQLSGKMLIEIASEAEYKLGVAGGKMDQTAILYGKSGKFLLLDNLKQEFTLINGLDEAYGLCLFDSGVKHVLADTAYNMRRQESEVVLPFFKKEKYPVKSLRDINFDLLTTYKTILPAIPFQRARYVLEENQRVLDCVEALQAGNIKEVGALMSASHIGLQHEYEVSCKELDVLFDLAMRTKGVLGARMMGGGFGGCTINLIEKKMEQAIIKKITDSFLKATGKKTKAFVVQPSDGLSIRMLDPNKNIA